MDHSSTARKNLRDLSNPMELRELNRQMEWIWRKILGGLTAKDFSDSGMRGVVNVVEKTVAETIKADEVTTNILKAALAEMMVAQIGVAKIDYANIVDAFAERIFTDTGLAGKFRANGLEVTSAQIVDLIVNSFRLVGADGKVYKVSIDTNGNLTTEYLSNEDALFSDGKIPDGYSAVSSSLTVGDVTAGKLYVAGAADIMKLTAKYLSADEAFIRELTSYKAFITCLRTNQAFVDMLYTGRIYGGKSLELIVGDVSRAQSAADTAKTAADKAQSSVDNLAVGGRNYIRNGNFSAGENHWAQWGSPTTREVVEMSGKHWLHIAGNADLEFQGVSQVLPFMRNEPLVVSFTAYASVENTALTLLIHQMGLNNDPQIYNSYTLGTAPKRYSKTFTSADDATKATFKLMLGPRKSANDVYITDIKFERGNRATDWTPAPEDTNSRIDDARTAADKAQSDIDGMAIGGRNLVLKSDAEKGPARNNQYDIAANRFIAGEYYACSVEMKSPSERSVDVYLNDDSGTNRINIPFSRWLGVKLTPDWVRYSFVYKANRDFDYPGKDRIVLRAYGTTADTTDISVRRVKVEKGNKATDWTAAPEDTDGKIDTVSSRVDAVEKNAIYDSATPPTTAETGQKWIDRGVSPAAFRRWKGLTTTPAGAAMTTTREVEETVSGTSVSLDNSGEQINSALAVSVRGKNLLDIYALCDGISYVQGGTIGKWPENGGFDLTATANDCYTEPWNGANYNIPVKPNTTYTLSWDIYIVPNTGTSAVMWFIDHRFEAGYYGQALYDAHFVTFTTPSDAQTVSFRFGVQNSGESVGYANLQLEEGDARTAFSAYKTAATVTHNGTVYTLPLSNDADHDAAVEIEPLSGTNTISTAADAMEVIYTCSGWETIGDMSALQKTVDAQTLQAAALENAMNETSRLAKETAANFKRVIEIQSGADGGLIVGDNLSNCSIKIKSASIELRVGNTAVATYAQDYVRLQDMQIRVPAGVGGLVLSKFDKE